MVEKYTVQQLARAFSVIAKNVDKDDKIKAFHLDTGVITMESKKYFSFSGNRIYMKKAWQSQNSVDIG